MTSQRAIYASKAKGVSPSRDHFIEGQISVRSPRARNSISMLKAEQRMQADRLAAPKRKSIDRTIMAEFEPDSPRANFLRKTQGGVSFASSKMMSPRLEGRNSDAGLRQLANSFTG